MKKILLTSLVAVFAVTAAVAAPAKPTKSAKTAPVAAPATAASAEQENKYWIGGSVGLSTGKNAPTAWVIAPEFGYKLTNKWDLGLDLGLSGISQSGVDVFGVSISPFARYNLARFGAFNLLLKGSVGFEFDSASAGGNSVSGQILSLDVVLMVTYDLTRSFTLFANLNFLGLHAAQTMGDLYGTSSSFTVGVNANNVANTGDIQVGFYYKF